MLLDLALTAALAIIGGLAGGGLFRLVYPGPDPQELIDCRCELRSLQRRVARLECRCDEFNAQLATTKRDLEQGLDTAQWALQQLEKNVAANTEKSKDLEARIAALEVSNE